MQVFGFDERDDHGEVGDDHEEAEEERDAALRDEQHVVRARRVVVQDLQTLLLGQLGQVALFSLNRHAEPLSHKNKEYV